MKTAEEENAEGVYYCGPVKTSHKGFFLATLVKNERVVEGGLFFMKNSSRVMGNKPLITI